ncbi:MAG: hypothetical protein PUE85_10640 [Firmicutes bacterium]|nr:hypothetical protein [Bacillota bacterium]
MKNLKKMLTFAAFSVILLTITISANGSGYNSETDPLVSLSYVNEVLKPQIIDEAYESILSKLLADYPILTSGITGNNSLYEAVHLKGGQIFMAKSSCEVVMTAGSATVIITSQENINAGIGLNDLTGAKRILDGEDLPRDHYVIIPRADGRGFAVTSGDAYFMVRGDYQIETY